MSDRDLLFPHAMGAAATRGKPSLEDRIAGLFAELHDPLYRYLLLVVWNPLDSEELAQEAFLRLHRQLREGQSIENIKAWLFRVAHNLAMDLARQGRSTSSLSDDAVTREAEDRHAHREATPEAVLLRAERYRALDAAIATLTEPQRQCLLLRKEGFRYREIAAILGVRESTVLDHLRRAIERVSKELHGAGSL